MKIVAKPISFGLTTLVLVLSGTSSVFAANWIDCNGTVVTKETVDGKPASESKPAHDIYAFDDATKNFYKYSETRKTTDPEPVKVYTEKEIRWGDPPQMGSSHASWEGKLNRDNLSLTLDYRESGTDMSWSQQCKPTSPIPDLSAQAGNTGDKG